MTNTNKKNQHYIPKFYLKNFSYKSKKVQIGIYNLLKHFYFQTAALKAQGSKSYYYGKDGVFEDKLALIENDLALTIKKILDTKSLPLKNTLEHKSLLSFVAITYLRNPIWINCVKNIFEESKRKMFESDKYSDLSSFVPSLSHEDSVVFSFNQISDAIASLSDLDFKLLINETDQSFVTSDFPIIKYNQYMEGKKWHHSNVGFGTIGLQIFIPLNSQIMLMFFDSGIYKVGDRKKKALILQNRKDIQQLNILQYINCSHTIFFDETISENYIKELHNMSNEYNKANIMDSKLGYLETSGTDRNASDALEKQNIMIMAMSNCEINLKLDGIKIHSKGNSHKLSSTVAQLRPHVEKLVNSYR